MMPIPGMLVVAVCLSCTDAEPAGPGTAVESPEPATGAAALLVHVVCTAQVGSRRLACRHATDAPGSGVRPAAALGQGEVKLTSSNVQYDSLTEIFSFDVTLQNLLAEPIGTPDGTTATGSKVVYVEGPTVTAYDEPGDTGTVTVDNPDGHGTFTALNQPYHFYPEILAPSQVSDTLHWRMAVPREVATFSFKVLVFSATPSEPKVPAEPPDSIPAWVYADSNMTHDDSPHMAGKFPRDVLWVSFKPEATQDEKQAAIDYIGGEVIGGSRIGGTYAVRVQDDGTTDPLFDAMEKFEALPQVRSAFVDVEIGGTYLRPSDGG